MFTETFREFVCRHDRMILETAFHVPHETVSAMSRAEVWDALQRHQYLCYEAWREQPTSAERTQLRQKKQLRIEHATMPDDVKRFGRPLNEHKSRMGRLALKQAIAPCCAIKNFDDFLLPNG